MEQHVSTFHSKNIYHFSIIHNNFANSDIKDLYFHLWFMYLCKIKYYCSQFFNIESPKKTFSFLYTYVWQINKFFVTVFFTVIFMF